MQSINTQSTVGELVAQYPALMRVFEELALDYCCGGKKTLAEACAVTKLDVNTVVSVLNATLASGSNDAAEQNWVDAPLDALADHIESTHHTYLHEELPKLANLVDRVTHVHGERHPELHEVQKVFNDLRAELESHLRKEEQVLFPAIRTLVQANSNMSGATLAPPIRVMIQEHDHAGDLLAVLRRLTDQYDVPADGCNSYKAMYLGLEAVELDLHRHIAKENNILFPRALAYGAA
jgi:regulator of cell morphogenesis and NO signaling